MHIYGQHEQALLLRPASHLDLLDRLRRRSAARERDGGGLRRLPRRAARGWSTLERARAALAERRELLEFQHRELADAAVRARREKPSCARERELLRHAERLQQVCRDGEAMLYSGQAATVAALGRLAAQLGELARDRSALAGAAELIDGGRVQLEEAALQLRARGRPLPGGPGPPRSSRSAPAAAGRV